MKDHGHGGRHLGPSLRSVQAQVVAGEVRREADQTVVVLSPEVARDLAGLERGEHARARVLVGRGAAEGVHSVDLRVGEEQVEEVGA